ncbi:MAG TPA: PfkB family carbohydrate kinase, partial [Anaerolineae bacterium]|nr:PfkB family carbohydrate kinase [Anaerolineae bacterium]
PSAMVKYVQECQELGIPYIYDPSQQIPRLNSADLVKGIEGAKILIVNDYEFEMIKKQTGLSNADIQKRVETVVITRGEKGSLIRTTEIGHRNSLSFREIHIPPAQPGRLAEPTGVGDAFRAGLITGLMQGYPWEVCGRLGSIAAIYVLEQHGTQRHSYTRKQFAQRYREAFGDTLELEDFVNYKK